MKLNPNELEFILDGIHFFDASGWEDSCRVDGNYTLTDKEIQELFVKLTQEKHSLENK